MNDWMLCRANYAVELSESIKHLKVIKCRGLLSELLTQLWLYFPGYSIEAFGITYYQPPRKEM